MSSAQDQTMELLLKEHEKGPQLQFQDIPLETQSDTTGSIQATPSQPPASSQAQAPPHISRGQVQEMDFEDPTAPLKAPIGDVKFWQLAYYQLFFDVDTSDVLWRIARSFVPYSDQFFRSIERNPDLYGPFWISTTLVFAIGIAGNFASYLRWYLDDSGSSGNYDEWAYDLGKITLGATIVYLYVTLVPLALYWALMYNDGPMKLTHVVCIYGYSLFVYIPTAFITAIPNDLVQIMAILVAFVTSTGFLLSNFWHTITNYLPHYRWVTIGAVFSLHAILALVMNLVFF